jgi:hypothetical protein
MSGSTSIRASAMYATWLHSIGTTKWTTLS